MIRHAAFTILVIGLAAAAANPAAAQEPQSTPPFGWMFTPSLVANTTWDDNALYRTEAAETPSDVLNVVNPRAAVDYKGRRGEFGGSYNGAFRLYRTLDGLNSYDQQGSASGRRLLSKHVTVFSGYDMAAAPTTDLLELVGVPYIRTGSKNQNLRGGVDAALSKHTTLSASYRFQNVAFDQTQTFNASLIGGHSHGVLVTLRRAMTPRLSLTADYDLQRATIGSVADGFEIYRTEGGVEYRLSDQMRVYGAGGVSRLTGSVTGPARTGPSWRAGLLHEFQSSTVDIDYSRSFVPSYGFGGTQENEELSGRFRLPLSRSAYTQSLLSWRRNEPLTPGGLKLRTIVLQASVGYVLTRWASIEGFYDNASQQIDRPGGAIGRQTIGVQIITSKPMRMR